MTNSADPDQLASSQLIWIYTVCKGRVYPGSAGQELKQNLDYVKRKIAFKQAQNKQIQIILHMPKVPSRPLLSIHTFCSIQWFC